MRNLIIVVLGGLSALAIALNAPPIVLWSVGGVTVLAVVASSKR